MKDQLKKYMWILEQLYTTGGITFKDLADEWKRSSLNDRQTVLAKRTFAGQLRRRLASISSAMPRVVICIV